MREIKVQFYGRAYDELMRLQRDEETITPNPIIIRGIQVYGIVNVYHHERKHVAIVDPHTHNIIEEVDISRSSSNQAGYSQTISIRFSDEVYNGLDRVSSENSVPIDEIIRRGVVAYGSVQRHKKEGRSLAVFDPSIEQLYGELSLPQITDL